mmetsp:Transcript_97957/g.280227  ORF Transcript_97957/g.280227 Transcript_97957/m.280227 type:complete len:200 (-) Transcript_97957:542-1141(-)
MDLHHDSLLAVDVKVVTRDDSHLRRPRIGFAGGVAYHFPLVVRPPAFDLLFVAPTVVQSAGVEHCLRCPALECGIDCRLHHGGLVRRVESVDGHPVRLKEGKDLRRVRVPDLEPPREGLRGGGQVVLVGGEVGRWARGSRAGGGHLGLQVVRPLDQVGLRGPWRGGRRAVRNKVVDLAVCAHAPSGRAASQHSFVGRLE